MPKRSRQPALHAQALGEPSYALGSRSLAGGEFLETRFGLRRCAAPTNRHDW